MFIIIFFYRVKIVMVNVGILTVSDRCSKGVAVDESGPNLKTLVESHLNFKGKVCVLLLVSLHER